MPDSAACGPIDFVLLEFPDDANTKACGDAIMDLVKRDVIHLFDILVIRKALDGSYSGVDLTDVTSSGIGGFTAFEGARSGLVHDDDVRAAVEVMPAPVHVPLLRAVLIKVWMALSVPGVSSRSLSNRSSVPLPVMVSPVSDSRLLPLALIDAVPP